MIGNRVKLIALLFFLPFLAPFVNANEYPQRPVKIIVPYGVGGGVDAYGRALAAAAKDLVSVPLVVINKPGSTGMQGTIYAAESRADDHKLLITSVSTLMVSHLWRGLQSDPLQSLRIVAQIGELRHAVMVASESNYANESELIATLKATSKKMTWAHAGRGGLTHIGGLAFLMRHGLSAQDIPFSGGARARIALIGGQVDFAVIGLQQAQGFQDRVRVLKTLSDSSDDKMKRASEKPITDTSQFDTSSVVVVLMSSNSPMHVFDEVYELVSRICGSEKYEKLLAIKGLKPKCRRGEEARKRVLEQIDELSPVLAFVRTKKWD